MSPATSPPGAAEEHDHEPELDPTAITRRRANDRAAHIESGLRQLKDPHVVGLFPMFHSPWPSRT